MWGTHPIPWNKGKKGYQVAWNKKEKVVYFCIECKNKREKLESSKRKFCLRKCYANYLKKIPAEKTSNWHGGIAKTWNKRNKELRNFYTNRRRAIKRGNGGNFTKKEWEDLKESCFYTCKVCGLFEPQIKLTIDHIKPVSKGGNSYISNIQPLCLSCNSRKNNNEIEADHRRRLTFL